MFCTVDSSRWRSLSTTLAHTPDNSPHRSGVRKFVEILLLHEIPRANSHSCCNSQRSKWGIQYVTFPTQSIFWICRTNFYTHGNMQQPWHMYSIFRALTVRTITKSTISCRMAFMYCIFRPEILISAYWHSSRVNNQHVYIIQRTGHLWIALICDNTFAKGGSTNFIIHGGETIYSAGLKIQIH